MPRRSGVPYRLLSFQNYRNPYIRNAFILRLPFRLRTGTLLTLPLGTAFTVVLRNRLSIPQGTSSEDVLRLMWVGERSRPRDDFWHGSVRAPTRLTLRPAGSILQMSVLPRGSGALCLAQLRSCTVQCQPETFLF